jgi:predicted nuclease of predicted toxin-antitoxin system
MPRFLVDAQLPPGLARRLVECGHDALHINDTDLREATDREIWNFALRNEYVVITKDVDFVILSNLSPKGAPIVWIRLGNVGNARLWSGFGPLLPSIVERLARGERLVEVSP